MSKKYANEAETSLELFQAVFSVLFQFYFRLCDGINSGQQHYVTGEVTVRSSVKPSNRSVNIMA